MVNTAQSAEGIVGHQPDRMIPVNLRNRELQIDHIINADVAFRFGHCTDRRLVDQAQRLTFAVATDKGNLFCFTDTLGKELLDVLLQVDTAVFQHLIGCEDGSGQLVCIQHHLTERGLTERPGLSLDDPCGIAHTVSHRNM